MSISNMGKITYRCGHTVGVVKIDNNIESFRSFMKWKEEDGGDCFYCFNSKKDE